MLEKHESLQTTQVSGAEQEGILIRLIKKYNKLIEKIHKGKRYMAKIDKMINNNSSLKTIDDKEYEELLALSKQLPEFMQLGELKRKELFDKIEDLLKTGENPNLPGIALRRNYSNKNVPVKIYPLHMAIDDNLIMLLLKYGANPNIGGYMPPRPYHVSSDSYSERWDNMTALELACSANHDIAKIFLSQQACKLTVDSIENALMIMLDEVDRPYKRYYRPYGFHTLEAYIIDEATVLSELNLILLLSEKASEKCLIGLLESELKHEKRALGIINSTCEGHPYRSGKFDWYNLIKQKLAIYNQVLSKKLATPIWLILFMGHAQKDNHLNSLTHDLLLCIVSKLLQIDIWEGEVATKTAFDKREQENALKVEVFKKIYPLVLKYDSNKDALVSPIDIQIKTQKEIISLIEKEFAQDGNSLIAKAWELTLTHYNNFSSKNDFLVQALTMWAAKNNSHYSLLSSSVYKLTLFDSTNESHLLSIKQSITDDLEALTKGDETVTVDDYLNKRL